MLDVIHLLDPNYSLYVALGSDKNAIYRQSGASVRDASQGRVRIREKWRWPTN